MSNRKIAVLERGFVYVGTASVADGFVTIEGASNVRRWGTKRGLGQLAAEGPQPNTVLDPAGRVVAPITSLICLIDCNDSVWPAAAEAA